MRSLTLLAAHMTANLQAAAVSSQLDPRAVTDFAASTVEALAVVAATLDAIDPDTAATLAERVADLAKSVNTATGALDILRAKLDAIEADAADTARRLEETRAAVVALGEATPAAKP